MQSPFVPPSGMSAGQTLAQLTRAQWVDWYTTWKPFEDKLIEFQQSPTAVADSMARASQNVQRSFDMQEQSTAERLQGYGLSLSADESAALKRSSGLARSLADVNAQNSARDMTRARQMSILGNPAPTVGG